MTEDKKSSAFQHGGKVYVRVMGEFIVNKVFAECLGCMDQSGAAHKHTCAEWIGEVNQGVLETDLLHQADLVFRIKNGEILKNRQGHLTSAPEEAEPLKGKPLGSKKKVRLQLQVEGMINSRRETPSSRVLADNIVDLVEDCVLRKKKPMKRGEAKPWGKRRRSRSRALRRGGE